MPGNEDLFAFSSNGVLAIGSLPPGDRQIARYHFPDKLRKTRLWLPAELLPRLAGVTDQLIDFGGAEIGRIDAHDGLAGFLVDAAFLDTRAAPLGAAADLRERHV